MGILIQNLKDEKDMEELMSSTTFKLLLESPVSSDMLEFHINFIKTLTLTLSNNPQYVPLFHNEETGHFPVFNLAYAYPLPQNDVIIKTSIRTIILTLISIDEPH
jgi:hypothetical protein